MSLPRRSAVAFTMLLCLGGAVACVGLGDEDLATLEPEAAPLQPSYSGDVVPFLDRYCINCHSGEAPGTRRVEPYFDGAIDDEDDWCDAFVQVDTQAMPPGAMERPSAVERLMLRRWVELIFASDPDDCDELVGDDDDDDD